MDQSRRGFLQKAGGFSLMGLAGTPWGPQEAAAKPKDSDVSEDQESKRSHSSRKKKRGKKTFPVSRKPIEIGEERQLFLDHYLLADLQNVSLKVHEPTRQPECLVWDKPWEGASSTYGSVLYDPELNLYRLYYLGAQSSEIPEEERHPSYICYMESRDGIHWDRPEFDFPFGEIPKTNILFEGMEDFNPFIDKNSDAKPEERYKAVCVYKMMSLSAWSSPDGLHWTPVNGGEPVFTDGRFDSQNVAFWSEKEGCYVLYFRDARRDARDVGRAVSSDFIHWERDGFIEFPNPAEGPHILGQFYTNQIQPYYRAPSCYLGFPARYTDRGTTISSALLPEQEPRRHRGLRSSRFATALTDSVFIVSHNGRHFRESPDVFLKPGLKTKNNWGYGDNYIAWGLLETDSVFDDQPRELTLYATESRWTEPDTFWRRYTLRLDGFSSLAAASKRGYAETKPFIFHGTELSINASTSALGTIRAEFRTPEGKPIPGYTAMDCDLIYGDSLDRIVTWQNDCHVAALEKKPVVLRFYMQEADIYSMKFSYGDSTTKRA